MLLSARQGLVGRTFVKKEGRKEGNVRNLTDVPQLEVATFRYFRGFYVRASR